MFSLRTLPDSTIGDDTILVPPEVSVPGLPLRVLAKRAKSGVARVGGWAVELGGLIETGCLVGEIASEVLVFLRRNPAIAKAFEFYREIEMKMLSTKQQE